MISLRTPHLCALSNGSRLSCGAKLECSQTEFYYTVLQNVHRIIAVGRRQLQALVRLRTTGHSSGPSSPGAQRGTHRRLPRAGTVRPNGPLLGTRHARRAPTATAPSFGKRFRIEPNQPDGCRPQTGRRPRGCSEQDLVWGELRSLTDRA